MNKIRAVQLTFSAFDARRADAGHQPGIIFDPSLRYAVVETPAGKIRAEIGDWIVRDRKGRLHVFRAGYWPPHVSTDRSSADDVG